VTVITHGFNSSVDDWITSMSDKIPLYPLFAGSNFSCYAIEVTRSGGQYFTSATFAAGVSPADSDSGEIVIKLDWSTISATFGVSSTNIAAAATAALLSTNLIPELGGHPLVELPLHFIGHSRGASVITEMARLLGAQGIWVDHVTMLDPRPTPAFGDPSTMKNYANILFADNYWQNLGNGLTDPIGQPITGAYNRQLTNLSGAYSLNHSDVHLWYHGTLDLVTPTSDSVTNITTSQRQNWWTSFEAGGTNAGFVYSLIGGGDRLSAAEPVGAGKGRIRDGVNQVWDFGAGVTATNRNVLPTNNGAWPNLIRLNVTSTNHFSVDLPVSLAFYCQFGANTSVLGTVQFYVDPDQNPYNANAIAVSQATLAGTGTSNVLVSSPTLALNATNTVPGIYRLFARIDDGAHSRYLYAPQKLFVDPSLRAPVLLAAHLQSGQFEFQASVLPGQKFVLQGSTNLTQWIPLSTNTVSGTAFDFADPLGPGFPRRFYRLLLVP